MSDDMSKARDALTRVLGMTVALGALAYGAVSAIARSEQARRWRHDMERQMADLNRKVEQTLTERRPDIESAIQKGKQAVVGGLDVVKQVVEQGADRAQEYVHKAPAPSGERWQEPSVVASPPTAAVDAMTDTGDAIQQAVVREGEDLGPAPDEVGEPTRRIDTNGSSPEV